MYGWIKTEAQFLNFLRSGMRRFWSKHPVKQALEREKRFKYLAPGDKQLTFHIECAHCGIPHKLKMIECNHKKPCTGDEPLSLSNFGVFCQNLMVVTRDDLEMLCKKCHAIVTYSERSGMSMADAAIEKKVIKFGKLTATEQKAKLALVGIGQDAKNITQRKDAVRAYLKARQ